MEFIKGKWYEHNDHIGKFKEIREGIVVISEYIYIRKYYKTEGNWGYSTGRFKEVEISEIAHLLPKDHEDLKNLELNYLVF